MQRAPAVEPPPALARPSRTDVNGLTGTIFSAIGLVGWLVTLTVLFSFQYDGEVTTDGQRAMVIQMSNGVVYLLRVATGLFGLVVFGFFSAVGTIVSALGLSHERPALSRTGFGLGVAGVAIGGALILWRLLAWGLV
jgi:hypothetical protein